VLTLEGVDVLYGPIRAVEHVSLRVEEGEVLALLGPNGAGKTTLLSAIAGIVPVAAGRIRFAGADITGRRPEDIARLGISLIPEGRRIFASLTVGENLRLGTAAAGRGRRAADRAEVLELFPALSGRLSAPAGTLSGGQQQQLAIARSLMSGPRLLLLDEPSLGLAPLIVDRIFQLIGRLNQQGMTVLLVEQNVHRALEVAAGACVLSTGRLEFSGRAAELRQAADLMSTYFGTGAGP
jgi:branched-chain amino acid transport system ATP-binding protein